MGRDERQRKVAAPAKSLTMPRSRGRRPPANPFWAYSLRLYRKPGVAAACIGLQDRLGIDVNVVLFCLWMAACGQTVAPATMRLAAGLSRVWSANVVGPLRGARRFLKPLELPELRGAVARVELAAERVEQDLLWRIAPRRVPPPRPPSDAAERAMSNLIGYIAHWPRAPRAADRQALCDILRAAFPAVRTAAWRTRLR